MLNFDRETKILLLVLAVGIVIFYTVFFGVPFQELMQPTFEENSTTTVIEEVPEVIQDKDITEQITDYSNCLEKELSAERNYCLLEIAKQSDSTVCDLTDDFFQPDCFKALAIYKKDSELCARISLDTIKYECYSELGKKLNSSEICLKIPFGVSNELRGTCLNETAIHEKNVNICTKINVFNYEGEPLRDNCIKHFYSKIVDSNICTKMIRESSKRECYLEVARNTNDYNLCYQFIDSDETDEFKLNDSEEIVENCIYNIATKSGKLEGCYLLSNEEQKTNCIEKALEVNLSIDSCNSLKTLSEKNICFKDFAIEKEDELICEYTEGDFDSLANCYKELALLKKDALICSMISIQKNLIMEDCYYEIAIQENNAAYCEFIGAPRRYFSCFVQIASSLEDVGICLFPQKEYLSTFTNYPIKDLCIKEFVINEGDTSYCPRINNLSVKEACEDLNVLFV